MAPQIRFQTAPEPLLTVFGRFPARISAFSQNHWLMGCREVQFKQKGQIHMLHTFEVRGRVAGSVYVALVIRATSSFAAQQAFLAQYPNGSVSGVTQLD